MRSVPDCAADHWPHHCWAAGGSTGRDGVRGLRRADRAGQRPGRTAVRVPPRRTGRPASRDPGPRRQQGQASRPARRVRRRPHAPADGCRAEPVRPAPRRHHLPRRDRPVRPRHRPGHPRLRRHPRRHSATAGTRRSQADQREPTAARLLPGARPANPAALAGRVQHRPDGGLRRHPRRGRPQLRSADRGRQRAHWSHSG